LDSLTHIVLGAAIGHQLLSNKIGKHAMFYGAIVGSLPDVDILFGWFTDPITAIEIHRGITHALVCFIFITPIISYLIKSLEKSKEISFSILNLFVFLTLVSHALLDVLTTWGTVFFWPLPYKLAVQSVFVVDPLFTFPVLFGLLWSLFKKQLRPNIIGFSFGLAYLICGLGLKQYSLHQFETALKNKSIKYEAIQNKPSPLNTILWSANVKTSAGFYIGYFSLFDKKPISFQFFSHNHHLVNDDLKKDVNFNRMVNISDDWYTISKFNNQLYFNDLRFGMMGLDQKSDFVFSYKIVKKNNRYDFIETKKNAIDGKLMLKQLISRIYGD
jgi:inner membrane protein